MTLQLVNDNKRSSGVRELSYLLPINEYVNIEVYSKEFDKELLEFFKEDGRPNNYLFYVEKFPSLVTKIRSYKGLLENNRDANFEKKINTNESYLGFLIEIDDLNQKLVFEYFFTPNNCCLIQTESENFISKLKEDIFEFNFYNHDKVFWIDYDKLSSSIPEGSRLIHFHVNPENENELGIKEYRPAPLHL